MPDGPHRPYEYAPCTVGWQGGVTFLQELPPARVLDFARAALSVPAGNATDEAVVSIAEHAQRQYLLFWKPVSLVLGAQCVCAFTHRALQLTSQRYPAMAKVEASMQGALTGLEGALSAEDPSVSREACALVLAYLLWNLISFLGEPLVLRFAETAWPSASRAGVTGVPPHE
jgi:hypothetical protein